MGSFSSGDSLSDSLNASRRLRMRDSAWKQRSHAQTKSLKRLRNRMNSVTVKSRWPIRTIEKRRKMKTSILMCLKS